MSKDIDPNKALDAFKVYFLINMLQQLNVKRTYQLIHSQEPDIPDTM